MKYILITSVVCLSFLSCSKDSSDSPTASNQQLITTGTWKYESGGGDLDKNGTIDLSFESTGIVPPCLLDNVLTFNTDGSGVNDEGTTKCDPALPQTTPFNWSFANNETSLNITSGAFAGMGGQFKIVALTDSKLTISKDTTLSSIPAAIIVNLKH